MIISASYKTDIPAFYGRWFLNRLNAGYCLMINPYGRQTHRIDLSAVAVDGFVFWTRNAGPFGDALEAVAARGNPFMIQVTVTGYPRALESNVLETGRAVDQIRALAERWGPAPWSGAMTRRAVVADRRRAGTAPTSPGLPGR